MADDAGALLVRSGLVSSSALDEARARVTDAGGTLGEQLVVSGAVADDKLTDFYRQRLLVPQVNPNTLARLPAKVVALIPSNMAVELRAIPVSLDGDNNLTVAMSDPSDRHGVDEIAFFTGTYVVRAVATQMQIAWCLAHYYGHVTDLGQRLLQSDTAPNAPRRKSLTDQVKLARTRRLERGEVKIDPQELEKRPTVQQSTVSDDQPTPVDTPTRKPRARTASGEIRPPQKRAPSVRPPLPEESGEIVITAEPSGPVITIEADFDSGPVITIEADEAPPVGSEDVTARTKAAPRPVPKRRRPAEPDPPELAARAGEVQLATGESIRKIDFEEPSIMISDELERVLRPTISGELDSGDAEEPLPPEDLDDNSTVVVGEHIADEISEPVVIRDQIFDEKSEPVLLERRRPSDGLAAPLSPISDVRSDVVVLREPKPKRVTHDTQVGIGAVPAATKPRNRTISRDDLDEQSTELRAGDRTRFDAHAVPPGDYTSTSEELLAAPPSPYAARDLGPIANVQPKPAAANPPPSGQVRLDRVQRRPSRSEDDEYDDDDDAKSKPTIVMSAVELDELVPDRSSHVMPAHLDSSQETDDGWGPPGTTIPPPLLGAIPGSQGPRSGVIPIPNIDTAPLLIAPPRAPAPGARPRHSSDVGIARALEEATGHVLELIHTLDHTTERDQIIAVMIAHLAQSHQRAGFFAVRAGELSLFAIMPRVPSVPSLTLRLDRPSTLQDVVGTRLPYRGPMQDDVSRQFLQATLGACPDELLLVPITVRERVVGVLFGDQRVRHTFDDQLALAARAAGMALERILKAKRG